MFMLGWLTIVLYVLCVLVYLVVYIVYIRDKRPNLQHLVFLDVKEVASV